MQKSAFFLAKGSKQEYKNASTHDTQLVHAALKKDDPLVGMRGIGSG